jgi:hypothetical protein
MKNTNSIFPKVIPMELLGGFIVNTAKEIPQKGRNCYRKFHFLSKKQQIPK